MGNVTDMVVLENRQDDMLCDRHGCPAYVSPEILNLNAPLYSGKAADVWSLGVLLYVSLMGKYPFYDAITARLFYKIRRGTFRIPSDGSTSAEVRALLRGLLRSAPKERPSASILLGLPWLQTGGASDRVRLAAKERIDKRKAAQPSLEDQVVPILSEDRPKDDDDDDDDDMRIGRMIPSVVGYITDICPGWYRTATVSEL
jgi:serine/threonine protein kinase